MGLGKMKSQGFLLVGHKVRVQFLCYFKNILSEIFFTYII